MKYLVSEEWRTKRGNVKYLGDLRVLARNNRMKMTDGESVVWELLRKDRIGFHFLRQKPIGRFIIDFYCPKLLIAVEVDGLAHRGRGNYDDGRDEYLSCLGVKTLRYENEFVIKSVGLVKEDLTARLKVREKEILPFQGRELEGGFL